MTRRGLLHGIGAASIVALIPLADSRAGNQQTVTVTLADDLFEPAVVRVRPGQAVVFHNRDHHLHSVTLLDLEPYLDEVFIDPGESHRFVVPTEVEPGEYALRCTIHIEMRGTLVVEEAG